MDAKWSSGKLARWALRLGEYDLGIHHTKGALNAAADALSRYPLEGRPCALSAFSPHPSVAVDYWACEEDEPVPVYDHSSRSVSFWQDDDVLPEHLPTDSCGESVCNYIGAHVHELVCIASDLSQNAWGRPSATFQPFDFDAQDPSFILRDWSD